MPSRKFCVRCGATIDPKYTTLVRCIQCADPDEILEEAFTLVRDIAKMVKEIRNDIEQSPLLGLRDKESS